MEEKEGLLNGNRNRAGDRTHGAGCPEGHTALHAHAGVCARSEGIGNVAGANQVRQYPAPHRVYFTWMCGLTSLPKARSMSPIHPTAPAQWPIRPLRLYAVSAEWMRLRRRRYSGAVPQVAQCRRWPGAARLQPSEPIDSLWSGAR